MYDVADAALLAILRKGLPKVPKENFTVGRVEPKGKRALPSVVICDADFSLQDLSLGAEGSEEREEHRELLSGDGASTSFTLSTRPIKPLTRVESPVGHYLKEGSDFKVDYGTGMLSFSTPPKKGKENISVTFVALKSVSVDRGVKVAAKYLLDVWAGDKTTADEMAEEAIRSLLVGRDELAKKGLDLKLLGGKVLEESGPSVGWGKRLECTIEGEIHAKIPVGAIEKIELEKKPFS